MGPTRCWASASCLPQGRRCRHDDSACNVRTWRRLHDNPERSGTGSDPTERFGSRRNVKRPGARPGRRFGRWVRPVGSLAESGSRSGCPLWAGQTASPGAGPLRSCAEPVAHGCVHRAWHTSGGYEPAGNDPHGFELAGSSATCPAGAGGVCGSVEQAADAGRFGGSRSLDETDNHRGRPGPFARPAGAAALPQYPPAGRIAGECGGES